MTGKATQFAASAQPPPEADLEAAADLWLGLQVRGLRKAKGLSLRQLAERARLSTGMISQIERGISSPSIRSLRQISEALGVPPSRLFHDGQTPPVEEIGKIVRRDARKVLSLQDNGVSKHLLTPDPSGTIELLLVVIKPGGSSGPEHYTHKGEDAGLVLSGELELWIDSHRHILSEGDSFRFRSTLPHRFANASDRVTEVLWAISPPLY